MCGRHQTSLDFPYLPAGLHTRTTHARTHTNTHASLKGTFTAAPSFTSLTMGDPLSAELRWGRRMPTRSHYRRACCIFVTQWWVIFNQCPRKRLHSVDSSCSARSPGEMGAPVNLLFLWNSGHVQVNSSAPRCSEFL